MSNFPNTATHPHLLGRLHSARQTRRRNRRSSPVGPSGKGQARVLAVGGFAPLPSFVGRWVVHKDARVRVVGVRAGQPPHNLVTQKYTNQNIHSKHTSRGHLKVSSCHYGQ